MKKYFLGVLLLLTMLEWSGAAMRGSNESRKQVTQEKGPMGQEGFGISVSVNKPVYSGGEPISLMIRVFNTTDQVITCSFAAAQRYDYGGRRKTGSVALVKWAHICAGSRPGDSGAGSGGNTLHRDVCRAAGIWMV